MPDGAYLIDSNILIRWVKPDDRDYPLVNSVIEGLIRQRGRLCYTSQNLAEFWNACTRPPGRNGYGLSTNEADLRARVIENTLDILDDGPAVHREWRRLIVAYRVSGVQVHDARLVAAMHVHGVKRILTFNGRDFTRYPTVEALHPQSLAGRMS
ncbi:MAG: type II toxin-antitoxin system VapC family toxin [Acidobacteriaceae bacterium]